MLFKHYFLGFFKIIFRVYHVVGHRPAYLIPVVIGAVEYIEVYQYASDEY